jgi:AmmeMemoRadiSam system protein A
VSGGRLGAEERRELLGLARRAIEAELRGKPLAEAVVPEALRSRAGAFVTLKTREGELRGCIGYVEPRFPLAEAVARAAVAAATDDPRFPAVTQDELGDLAIDVSVLGPAAPIAPSEVRVGTHGLVVERGPRRGLLLPQVAVEQLWDAETFLDHTCRKAGLPPGSWREAGTRVLAFEAEVFGEEPPTG